MLNSSSPLTIVVIGANGYSGRALLRLAARQPDTYTIRAQVRESGTLNDAKNIRTFKGSLEQINPELFPDEPHILVHMAGKNIDHDGTGFEVNIHGTENLLAHCNEHSLGILYHSSLSVLGQNQQRNVSNQQPPSPKTSLARSRAGAEKRVLDYAMRHNKSAYCLRPRFILGKEDAFVMPALIKLVRKGLFIGDGRQQFSVIDVDDYAQLILELCQHLYACSEPERLALNVGYQKPLSFSHMYEALQTLAPNTRIKRRIACPGALATAFNWLPVKRLHSLATQLQLIGLDHYSDVSETRKRLRNDILSRDSFVYFRELAQHFKDSSCN